MRKHLAFVVVLGLAGPALAAQGEGKDTRADITTEQCRAAYAACTATCDSENPDSTAGRMGCEAACAGERAGCEVMAGLDEVTPWVADQYEAARDFIEEFLGKDREKGTSDDPKDPDVREI